MVKTNIILDTCWRIRNRLEAKRSEVKWDMCVSVVDRFCCQICITNAVSVRQDQASSPRALWKRAGLLYTVGQFCRRKQHGCGLPPILPGVRRASSLKRKRKKIPLSLIIDWQPIIDVKCHFEGTTCYCILYEYVDLRSNCSTTKPTQSPDLQHPQPMK